MRTECRKMLQGVGAALMIVVVGCDGGGSAFERAHKERIDEIRHMVGAVCSCGRDRKPMDDCLKTFVEVSSITNHVERRQWLAVFCNAIANAKPSGADMLARQDNYTNLHNFREKASDGLGMEGDDLRVRLEMWFAEAEAFRKESAFCDAMAADINAAFTGSRPSKVKLPPDFNDAIGLLCEWETSAKQSKLWHEYDMAPIVLWDDSVAARYCATLPWWKKKMVVWRINKAIGCYPDWYLDEQKKGKRRAQKAGGAAQ